MYITIDVCTCSRQIGWIVHNLQAVTFLKTSAVSVHVCIIQIHKCTLHCRGQGGLVGTFFIDVLIKRKRAKFNGWVITSVKVIIWATNPGVYKCSDHFQLFQKFAANMTMSSVPTNPPMGLVGTWYGVCWILLNCHVGEKYSYSSCLYSCFRPRYNSFMVTIYFIFSQHICFKQITMNCVKKCQLTLISWDGTTVQLTPTPMCQLTPMTFVYFMLLLQKAETTMTNNFSLTL